MAEFNVLDMCRLCLTSAARLDELTQRLTNIISTCFSLQICMSSEVTKKICHVCVEQLENIYKYRKKIIKSELILRMKIRENITNYSKKLCFLDPQKDPATDRVYDVTCNFNESKDVIDNEYNSYDSNMYVTEVINAEIEKKENAKIININDGMHELKSQTSGSILENLWQDFKTESIISNNLTTSQADATVYDVNDLFRHKDEMKSSSLDAFKNEMNLERDANIGPTKIESVNENDTILETNKENTDMNNLTVNDCAVNENDQFGDTDFIFNAGQNYAVDIDRKFMCLTCLNIFASQKELSTHYKTVELSKVVKETSKKYKDLDIVKVVKNGVGKTVFKCGFCSKVFENKAAGLKHTQVHKVERPFLCSLCNRTYKTVDDILRHGVVHSGNKFVCSYDCGYSTVHLGALREHVKRHKKEFKYKCDKCGKCFQVKTWFEQHQNVHDKVRPFVCKLCGQAFSMARYLTAHRANVHPQSSKVKRYKCGQCALPCDSRKCLVMHMKQKHGLKTDCLCDVCGQIFSDQQKLILHKSIHEASRKYSCGFCKKSFNKKDHKTVHEKIHTGERLNCNHCPKSFTQRCSLRRHIKRYHEGQQKLEQKT